MTGRMTGRHPKGAHTQPAANEMAPNTRTLLSMAIACPPERDRGAANILEEHTGQEERNAPCSPSVGTPTAITVVITASS